MRDNAFAAQHPTNRWTLALTLITAVALSGCVVSNETVDEESGTLLPGSADGWSQGAWNVEHDWSDEEEALFTQFIEELGRSRAAGECWALHRCLANPEANILWDERDEELWLFADCADLPMVLRAYFAFKRRLPFSFVSAISGDRYTSGNDVRRRLNHTNYDNFADLANGISQQVHSGFYRLAPEIEGSDHYPVAVNRATVRPGTIYYDPSGHVLLVYAVEDDGTVLMIDGHPDNSLTVTPFSESLARGGRSQGGGFRGWRPTRLDESGHFVHHANAECPGFSDEQYAGSFDVDGRSVGYHEWVRNQLALAGVRRDPVEEFEDRLGAICDDIQARVDAVDRAIDAGIAAQDHPSELPYNIYGTVGDWETYSTPGRDARLKAGFRALYEFVETSIELADAGLSDFDGSSEELVDAFLERWRSMSDADCAMVYENSVGDHVVLDLDDVMDRLFLLSFDPYHCPELRWGAAPGLHDDELASCPDDEIKLWWYQAEQRLRNIIDRDPDVHTTIDFGPETSSDINVRNLLEFYAI